MALCLCVSLTKTPRENRIFENPLLEVQSAFQAFWTPILKYTNIDYQCVTNLSPKSDEDRKSLPKPLRKEGMLDTFKRWVTCGTIETIYRVIENHNLCLIRQNFSFFSFLFDKTSLLFRFYSTKLPHSWPIFDNISMVSD